jgi:hypothetical protein
MMPKGMTVTIGRGAIKLAAWCAFGASLHVYGNESMRYLANGRLRLGIDLSLGGAVTVLEDKANGGANMINSHDWGRQIQLSYYSGPTPYIGPNGEQPHQTWAKLGWNPIQSGSVGKIRSKTLACEQPDARTLRVRCTPMQWPHDNVPGDCQFEVTYRLIGSNVVEMAARLLNRRKDKKQYSGRQQEMPALYTNGRWYRLLAYDGDRPFEHAPLTELVGRGDGKGWPWLSFHASERWAALVDDAGSGVGVFQPEVTRFLGGFAGGDVKKGTGGEREGQTGYIAPVGTRILDANIDWTYRAYLIVGTVEEIRAGAYALRRHVPDPTWTFTDDRHGWVYQGEVTDSGWPIKDGLALSFTGSARGTVVSPETHWLAAQAPVFTLDGAFHAVNASRELQLQVIIKPTGGRSVLCYPLAVRTDGVCHSYRLRLDGNPWYTGSLARVSIRMPSVGGSAVIRRISCAGASVDEALTCAKRVTAVGHQTQDCQSAYSTTKVQ